MSSSTSDSSNLPIRLGGLLSWRRWVTTFFGSFVVGLAVLYAIVVLSDPFSIGRFALFDGIDVTISERGYANAGRARDPRFDTAVIGNSHGARFEPESLDRLTGRRFVQLTVPGLNAEQQIITAQAFLRNHRAGPVGLFWVLDHYWCREFGSVYPDFPYWLYEPDARTTYLLHLFSTRAAQAAFHRIGIHVLKAPPAGRADGYVAQPPVHRPEIMLRAQTAERPVAAVRADAPFAWEERMNALMLGLPDNVRVVLVFLPNYISFLPRDGSPAAERLEMCKRRIAAIAGRSAQVAFVDRMRDDDIAGNPANFVDPTHVTDAVVRQLEADFAPAITSTMGRSQ
jgi:hypothetical protein